MIHYPKEDQKITLCTTAGAYITGMVNVAGRSLSAYLQDAEPDIIMYETELSENKKQNTLMVSKRQTLWISSEEHLEKDQLGCWQRLAFKLVNGQVIVGAIDITGYDRVSDYVQRYQNRFFEVFDCSLNGEKRDSLFVSKRYTMWKEPL